MEIRPFKEKTPKPNTELLKKALKDTFKCYEALMYQAKTFNSEWNFSKTSGWMLKVADTKKALFYVIPLEGSYRISLTVRENERKLFLTDTTLTYIYPKLIDAKKYSEGYQVTFQIQNSREAEECQRFIGKLIELR